MFVFYDLLYLETIFCGIGVYKLGYRLLKYNWSHKVLSNFSLLLPECWLLTTSFPQRIKTRSCTGHFLMRMKTFGNCNHWPNQGRVDIVHVVVELNVLETARCWVLDWWVVCSNLVCCTFCLSHYSLCSEWPSLASHQLYEKKGFWNRPFCVMSLGHPVPWRDPLKGLPTFFFFFFPFFSAAILVFQGPHRGKRTPDLGGILQKHAYWQSSPAVIKYFTCSHISLSYGHFLSKKYSKIFFVSPSAVMKSPIGLIFCRNMLMDSLQGQIKNGLAEVIFHWVILLK